MLKRHISSLLLAGAILATSNVALADKNENLSILGLPTTLNISNTYNSNTTFTDTYTFTIPDGSFNALSSSINLSNIFGVQNLSVGLYLNNGLVFSAITSQTVIDPQTTISVATIPALSLGAGTYSLRISGSTSGLFGGSYSGVMNIAAVPETESYALFIAGISLLGLNLRKKSA